MKTEIVKSYLKIEINAGTQKGTEREREQASMEEPEREKDGNVGIWYILGV